jgi:hypothetical protein
MKNVFIWGAGTLGRIIHKKLPETSVCLGFIDGNQDLENKKIEGIKIVPPEIIKYVKFDSIIIGTSIAYEIVRKRLIDEFDVPAERIDISYAEQVLKPKNSFIKNLSEIVCEKQLQGCIALCKVYQGTTAKKLNECFPDRTFYIFDSQDASFTLSLMPFPKNLKIITGKFQNTFRNISDNFVFAVIDFEKCDEILAALEAFYPRMTKNGIILIHDYFFGTYNKPGSGIMREVRVAVDEFCRKQNIGFMPIGDESSVAIVKAY